MRHPQTLLIVDDQLDNLKLLSDLLEENYRVQAVTSGQEALLLLNQIGAPDLLLLDIMMPVMDGYELCQRIKARPDTAHTPIIFLTAKNDTESEMRGFEVGAVDYVTKPVHPPALLARVSAHLALAAQMQQMQDERDLGRRILEQTQRTANAMAIVNREQEAQRLEQALSNQELQRTVATMLTELDALFASAQLSDEQRELIEKLRALKTDA